MCSNILKILTYEHYLLIVRKFIILWSCCFRLKTAAYPLTGAFLGTVIGGPVGMIAGFKIGGLAALGCAIAGYTGGKLFKKVHEEENPHVEITNSENVSIDGKHQEKKDIWQCRLC